MMTTFLSGVLLVLAAGPPDLQVSDPVPVQGKATAVIVRTEVGRVEAVSAPNSKVSKRERLTADEKDPRAWIWTPKQAGIVVLEAYVLAEPPSDPKKKGKEKPVFKKTLSVAFDGTPGSGLLIMMLAGCILFGGAFIALRSIMRS